MADTQTKSPASRSRRGQSEAAEAGRVPAAQPEGTERTRNRPVYAPHVDIIETNDALEIFADMPGVTKDSVEVTLEQRVLRIHGRADISLPEGVAPLYLEYEPGDYERAFTLSDAVDPAGIEARVRNGIVHLRLPKAGPAKLQRIEVRAD
jgi:HSP20 family molecular chaperone IbpA